VTGLEALKAVEGLKVSTAERLLLLALYIRANKEGLCWPTLAQLARDSGMTRGAVQKILQRLVCLGFIKKQTLGGNFSGEWRRPTTYLIIGGSRNHLQDPIGSSVEPPIKAIGSSVEPPITPDRVSGGTTYEAGIGGSWSVNRGFQEPPIHSKERARLQSETKELIQIPALSGVPSRAQPVADARAVRLPETPNSNPEENLPGKDPDESWLYEPDPPAAIPPEPEPEETPRPPAVSIPEPKPPEPDLFRKPRKPLKGPSRELKDALVAAWVERYGPKSPAWSGQVQSWVLLQQTWTALGGDSGAEAEIERRWAQYLSDGDKFFAGHPLAKFCSQCDRWAKRKGKHW